jgi:uncharacterized membrane protein YgcG
VFDRAETDTPPWFAEQVDRMTTPDLPAFDPSSASESAAGTGRASGRRTGGGRSGSGGGSTGGSERKSPMADVWDDTV